MPSGASSQRLRKVRSRGRSWSTSGCQPERPRASQGQLFPTGPPDDEELEAGAPADPWSMETFDERPQPAHRAGARGPAPDSDAFADSFP